MGEQTRDFDKEAASWDQEPRRLRLVEDVARAIAAEAPLGPDLKALDFGCGTGLLTLRLQPRVGVITGADTSPGMLAALEAKIAAQGLANVRTLLLDPAAPLALPERYDLIVSNMTLHHVPEIEPLLAGLAAALQPGGLLCLADLDLEQGQFHEDDQGVFHNGFDRAWLRGQLDRAGLLQVRERDAAVVNKPARAGGPRDFSVFLISGRKPA